MSVIKVILADDHDMFRSGLKGLLEKNSEFKVVAEAGNGEALLEKLKNQLVNLLQTIRKKN